MMIFPDLAKNLFGEIWRNSNVALTSDTHFVESESRGISREPHSSSEQNTRRRGGDRKKRIE